MEKKTNGMEKTGGYQPPRRELEYKGYQPSSDKPRPKPQDIRLPKGTGAVKPKKEK
jgi:hypothetical protein